MLSKGKIAVEVKMEAKGNLDVDGNSIVFKGFT